MSTPLPPLRARVLYLDHPGRSAKRLSQTLQAAGLEPLFAPDLETAQARLSEAEPLALVLAEREAGGQELLGLTGDLPLILLDSFGTAEEAAAAQDRGAREVLARPLPPGALVAACQRALAATPQSPCSALGGLSSRDPKMAAVLDLAGRVADSRASLLFHGESGTGKTRLARAVHRASARHAKPFIEVNCGALPSELLMSELFGHIQGAFTGADRDRVGKFEAADGGTLFLDEIATASPDMQVKLLRVLESGCFERVGDNQTRRVDVRVLAACNVNLQDEVAAGRFRSDLYWRLNVVAIELPPLRERPGDLIELAEHFQERFARAHGRELGPLSPLVQAVLVAHDWPGNVRELENTFERTVLISRGTELHPEDFGQLFTRWQAAPEANAVTPQVPPELSAWLDAPPGPLKAALEVPEALLIRRALTACAGNRGRTAAMLDINRSTLFNKMRRHGLSSFPMHLDSQPTPPGSR